MSDLIIDSKQQNLQKVLALFYEHEALSKPQIAELTGLSLPTIMGHMRDLEQQGLIETGALLRSSGGRPAMSYVLRANARLALGVEVRRNHIKICLCNLRGQIVRVRTIRMPYHDTPAYSEEFKSAVLGYLASLPLKPGALVGVGVALQAVVNKGGTRITFAKIIPITAFSVEPLQQALGIPVRMCHDVKSAALAELWHNRSIHNAAYIALSEHLGGALIKSRTIEHGRSGYAGSWDHLTIADNGRVCYCGRRGCLDTYCALSELLQGEEPAAFFSSLRLEGSAAHLRRWQDYLHYLSLGLYQVWLLLERRIILGGEIAYLLTDEDVSTIETNILSQSTFTYDPGFVNRAVVLQHAVATGAALPYLAEFIPEHVRPIEPWQT